MESDRMLDRDERKQLLELARGTVESLTRKSDPPELGAPLPGLYFKRGAFVTLHSRGRLRGCIGNFFSDDNLLKTVERMAVAAASQDPRFPPVRAEEMTDLDFEISVLSPLREIEDVNVIEVGVHGIFIMHPHGRGVLLPQVATEYGWTRDEFLEQTCLKAGLPRDAWREPQTKILVFSAQVFGEKDFDL